MTAADPALSTWTRALGWVRGHVPTRESLAANRFLRPVAHRVLVPALWRFNRRSVPRGAALGIFVGILFPFAHMPLAAVLALPARANVPTAMGITLLNNPLTIGPLLWAAYHIGEWFMAIGSDVAVAPLTQVQPASGLLHWLVAQGGPATVIGLIVIAFAGSAAGYAVAALAWRWRTARKWRRRRGTFVQ